jgi:hypothetical protein
MSIVPQPPVSPPKKGWKSSHKVHKASTLLMMKIKEAKENQLKSILEEDDETDASGNVGISFAHIMYILKQQRKNKQYFDLLLFVIFVTLYIFILTSNRAAFATNGLTRGIKNILIDEAFNEPEPGALYEDSRTYFDTVDFGEMWGWLQGPLANVLWKEESYYGAPFGTYVHGTNKSRRVVLGQTHLLGRVMMRQLRTTPSTMTTSGETYNVYPYVEDDWDQSMGAEPNGTYDSRYGTYIADNSLSNLNGVTTGFFTYISYGRNAWVTYLPADKTNATKELERLKNAGMADDGTAIISVDFNTINPSINTVTSVRIIFEMTSTGFLRHKAWLWSVPVSFYNSSKGIFRGVCEAIFMMGLIIYTVSEVRELMITGVKVYFKSMFNRIEVLNLVLFWYNVLAYANFMYNWNFNVDITQENLDLYGWTMYYNSNTRTAAFNTLICFFKVFKYLQVSPRFNLLWVTMGFASKDLVSFLCVWLLFMFGYCTVGILVYGPDEEAFVTYVNSFTTLFKILLGDFDYNALEASSPIMTPIFFVSFVVLVFFVTINMMVAIIIKGFERAKQNQADQAHRIKKVPFVYDSITENIYGTMFRIKATLGVISVPVEALTHHHAVHLLADPKMRQDMEDGAILTLNGDGQAAVDFDPKHQAELGEPSKKELKVREVRRKAIKEKLSSVRKNHALAKLDIWKEHLVAARRLKKTFAGSKSIKRAYLRLQKLENQIPRTVYKKVLDVDEMTTILGDKEQARQVIIDFQFLMSGAHHIDDDSQFDDDHSDSAHIVETNLCTKQMKAQLNRLNSDISSIKSSLNVLIAKNKETTTTV